MPVLFNEFCSTWGRPAEESVLRHIRALKGKGLGCYVIDAGWYDDESFEEDLFSEESGAETPVLDDGQTGFAGEDCPDSITDDSTHVQVVVNSPENQDNQIADEGASREDGWYLDDDGFWRWSEGNHDRSGWLVTELLPGQSVSSGLQRYWLGEKGEGVKLSQ